MLGSKASLALYATACAYTNVLGLALPGSERIGAVLSKDYLSPRASFAGGILLRIEPLGASITHGVASSDGNGYRKYLRDAIVSNGNEVDMVGNNPNGTMEDNDNSGWPGLIIDDVHTKSNTDTPEYKPNLVLLNVGTNDAIQDVDISTAGDRLSSLLTDVYAQSPQTTVILSGLIRNGNSTVQDRAVQINAQYQSLASSLQQEGKPIIWANKFYSYDISRKANSLPGVTQKQWSLIPSLLVQGPDGPQASDLSSDGTHPVDAGYQKMANVWYTAIGAADAMGFLKAAEDNGLSDA
ncbi:gdsl-like lipase acylhydrolase [Seiridium cupressi]